MFDLRFAGSRTQHTEFGSHASEDIHLAGIYAEPTDKITQSFCMKTIPVRDGDYSWEKGTTTRSKLKAAMFLLELVSSCFWNTKYEQNCSKNHTHSLLLTSIQIVRVSVRTHP